MGELIRFLSLGLFAWELNTETQTKPSGLAGPAD
jgi:hypothetical protein